MANLLSYPFRTAPDGTIAKTPEGEEYYAQELVNLILTTPGERQLVPDYGITDPVFDHLNTVELLGKVEMYGPPVSIDGDAVTVSWERDGEMNLDIEYTANTTDEEDQYLNDDILDDEDGYEGDDTDSNVNDYYSFNERTDY